MRVVDPAGAPIADAKVVLLTTNQRDTLARATTNETGSAVLPIDSNVVDRELVSRKIGYSRGDRFVHLAPGEQPLVTITMARMTTALAPVIVRGRRVLPYDLIGADEIDSMSLHRTIYEARDIVKKLRPDMLNASRCPPRPPPVTIWVNGKRIFSPGMPQDSVLAQIRAEHVSQIKYETCQSKVITRNGGQNAIFVVLKPGIAFDLKYGSFVVDADSMVRAINRGKP